MDYEVNSLSIAVCCHSLIVFPLSLRTFHLNQLTGTIPPELGNLTQLSTLYAYYRIVVVWSIYLISDACIFAFNRWMFTLRPLSPSPSLRYLSSNELTGTLPTQLGNLMQMQDMYAQNPHWQYSDACIIKWTHSQSLYVLIWWLSLSLLGGSMIIISLAPSPLSSATSLSSAYCTLTVHFYLTLHLTERFVVFV